MTKHVHIINTHGLGDVVMCMPMLREIDIRGYRISMTVKSKLEADLVRLFFRQKNNSIDFIYFQDYKRKGLVGLFKFLLSLRSLRTDIIVSAVGVSKSHYNILSFFSKSKFRFGQGGAFSFLNHFNWEKTARRHKAILNCEIFRKAEEFIVNSNPNKWDKVEFPPFFANNEVLSSLKIKHPVFSCSKIVGLAPGSGDIEKHKRWPIESYAELAKILLESGYGVVVLGGPGEELLGEKIAKHVNGYKNFLDLTGKQSLSEVVHTIYLLDKLVANCNGLSHLASVVNTPVVGIYGPTDPYYTGPYTKKINIVNLDLECSPCYERGFIYGCGNPVCMDGIGLKSVYNMVTDGNFK